MDLLCSGDDSRGYLLELGPGTTIEDIMRARLNIKNNEDVIRSNLIGDSGISCWNVNGKNEASRSFSCNCSKFIVGR